MLIVVRFVSKVERDALLMLSFIVDLSDLNYISQNLFYCLEKWIDIDIKRYLMYFRVFFFFFQFNSIV